MFSSVSSDVFFFVCAIFDKQLFSSFIYCKDQ